VGEYISGMLLLPMVWISLAVLALFTLLIVNVRRGHGPRRALLVGAIIWGGTSIALYFFGWDNLNVRHLIASAVIAGAAMAPMVLTVVLLPWRFGIQNILGAGIIMSRLCNRDSLRHIGVLMRAWYRLHLTPNPALHADARIVSLSRAQVSATR
jgi:hypothetical protein